jgi:hypothetical protein
MRGRAIQAIVMLIGAQMAGSSPATGARQLDGVLAKAGIKPGHDMKVGKLSPKRL